LARVQWKSEVATPDGTALRPTDANRHHLRLTCITHAHTGVVGLNDARIS
jgi:hypothetical protein